MVLTGCTSQTPYFGEVNLVEPAAQLRGQTHPISAAAEMVPGCSGFADPGRAEHILFINGSGNAVIKVRSLEGRLSLVAIREGAQSEVLCDTDDDQGHEPTLTIPRGQRVHIHVASPIQNRALSYDLSVLSAEANATDTASVSVTVLSEPAGATVRSPEGEELGTTPLMFRWSRTDARELTFNVDHNGESRQVTGIPDSEGVLRLTADFTAAGFWAENNLSFVATRQANVGHAFDNMCPMGRVEIDLDLRAAVASGVRIALDGPGNRPPVILYEAADERGGLHEIRLSSETSALFQQWIGQSAEGEWRLTASANESSDELRVAAFQMRYHCQEIVVAEATPPEPAQDARTRRPGRHVRPPGINPLISPFGRPPGPQVRCPDGRIVAHPRMCFTMPPATRAQCPDGRIVSNPRLCFPTTPPNPPNPPAVVRPPQPPAVDPVPQIPTERRN